MILAPTDQQVLAFTPQEKADRSKAERAARELCRRRLDRYWQRMHSPRQIGAWQIDLCARLQRFMEAVERQESPCMMVFAPPQYGKSLSVSQAWPAWMMGRHPEWNFILASYGQALAAKNGRWVRNVLQGPRHAQLFRAEGCRLAADSQALDEFRTMAGGQFISRGRGGGTTGQPAHIFIVDDPFADRQEAESKTIREGVWDWFWSVAETRLAPGGGKLVMNTRWHTEDLAGKLIQHAKDNPDADQWEIVSYPALAEKGDILGRKVGEPLHPERYTKAMVERKKRNLPARDWLSMYQQRPTAAEGTYFKVNLINELDPKSMPKMTHLYQAWDLALTPKKDADYSVGACIGKDHLDRYWLVDLVRGQWDPAETARQVTKFWYKHQAQMVWFEGGGPFLGVQPSLKSAMKSTGIWVPHQEISHGGKAKDVRAISMRGIINGGNLYVPTMTPWYNDLKAELASFPNGKNDDQVDALAYLGLKSMMMKTNENRAPLPKQLPAVERSQMVKRTYADLVKKSKEQAETGDW